MLRPTLSQRRVGGGLMAGGRNGMLSESGSQALPHLQDAPKREPFPISGSRRLSLALDSLLKSGPMLIQAGQDLDLQPAVWIQLGLVLAKVMADAGHPEPKSV